jgi:DNA-directed RNA polymerase subunit N (RpoN/RPB10)
MTEMEKAIKLYSIPNDNCSCRDENEDLTKIGKRYREYYSQVKKNRNGADVLTEMKIMRCCCRIKLLCLPVEPMIDRSSDRFTDQTVKPVTRENTRELFPLVSPPEFPSL